MTATAPDALARLLDRQALLDLVTAYFRGVDRCDFELLRSLYHPDAIDDHGELFCGPADAYVDWLGEVLPRLDATLHHMGSAAFALDGDRAEGEVQVMGYHRTKPPEPLREIFTAGRYLDVYERREGVWRFRKRTMVNDWVHTRPLNQADYDEFHTGHKGRNGEGDPSYAALTLFGRGRVPAGPSLV